MVHSLLGPSFLDILCSFLELLACKVIKHNDIGTGCNGFIGFFFRLALDLNFESETAYTSCVLYGLRNRSWMYMLSMLTSDRSTRNLGHSILPELQIWLSLSMTMDDKSMRCVSKPPTNVPYFSTSRKPSIQIYQSIYADNQIVYFQIYQESSCVLQR